MTDKPNGLRDFWRLSLIADQGERKNPKRCALVQDLKERYGNELTFPHVDPKTISFTHKSTGLRLVWKTPKSVAEWIRAFDKNENPEDSGVGLRLADAKILTKDERAPKPIKSKAPADSPLHKPRRRSAYR